VLCLGLSAQEKAINTTINQWHTAAKEANFDQYFGLMTTDAVFVGSDASEVWSYDEFKSFSKPYFDAGKAWTFTPIERHVYISDNQQMAWFDETLNSTHMGVCRGSGVLEKQEGNTWKIKHYVLSLAIPNDHVTEIVKLKKILDQDYIQNRP
jgi:ketosteroid isomerase-like protein